MITLGFAFLCTGLGLIFAEILSDRWVVSLCAGILLLAGIGIFLVEATS